MWYDNYTMAWCGRVAGQRYHEYRAGLMDHWEIVALYQDMLEAGCVPDIHIEHAGHLVQMGLCHIPGRVLQ